MQLVMDWVLKEVIVIRGEKTFLCILGRRIGGASNVYFSWPKQHVGEVRFQGGNMRAVGPKSSEET